MRIRLANILICNCFLFIYWINSKHTEPDLPEISFSCKPTVGRQYAAHRSECMQIWFLVVVSFGRSSFDEIKSFYITIWAFENVTTSSYKNLTTSYEIWYSFVSRMRCSTVIFLFQNDKTFPDLYSHLKPFIDEKIFVIFNAFILCLLIYFLLFVSSHLKVNIWPKAKQEKNFSILCKMLWNLFSVETNIWES